MSSAYHTYDVLLKVFKHKDFRSETQERAVLKVIEGKQTFFLVTDKYIHGVCLLKYNVFG